MVDSAAREMTDPREAVTALLHQWRQGDKAALDRLIPAVYDELDTETPVVQVVVNWFEQCGALPRRSEGYDEGRYGVSISRVSCAVSVTSAA